MLIRPMIGGWEVPRIERIVAREQRRLAVLPIPGLSGDLHQELGRAATLLEIRGSLFGDEARDQFLTDLREKFNAGEPVDFVADIVHEAELEQVLIDAFYLEESAAQPDTFSYHLVLREYTEPPEPPTLPGDLGEDFGLDVDADLLPDVDLGLDLLDLPALLTDLPEVGDLLAPLKPAAEELSSALEGAADLLSPLDDLLGD